MTEEEHWFPFTRTIQREVVHLQKLGAIRAGDLVCIMTSIGRVEIRFGEKPICPECKAPLDNI